MFKLNSLLKATLFALCLALFFVGTAVVEAANSALVVNVATCDECADVSEDDGFVLFLDRLSADGWNRWRISEGNAATHENVVAVVDSFVDGVEADSDAMIALKGRVVEQDGAICFLPTDAETTESKAIPLKDVVDKLENSSAKRCYLAVDDSDDHQTIADESFQALETSKVRVLRGNLCGVFGKIEDDQLPPQDATDKVSNCEDAGAKDVVADNQIEQTAEDDVCSSDEPVSPPQCVDSEGDDNDISVKIVDETIRLCSSSVLAEIANSIANEYEHNEHNRFVVVPTFVTDPAKRVNDSLLPLAERLARELDEDLSSHGFSTREFDEIQAVLAKSEVRLAPSPNDDEFGKMASAIYDATGETVDMVVYGRIELVATEEVDGVAVVVTVFESNSKRKKVFKGVFKADNLAKANLIGLSTTLSVDDTKGEEYSLVMPSWSDVAEADTKQDVQALVKPVLLDPEFDYQVSICVRDAEVANSKWEPREIVQDGVENVLLLGKSETFAVRVQNKSDKDVCARVVVDNKGTLPLNGGSDVFAPNVKNVRDERSWLIRSRAIGFIDGFYRFNKGKLTIGESVDAEDASFKLVNRTDANVDYYDVYPEKAGTIYLAIYEAVPAREKNDVNKVAIIPDMGKVVRRLIKIGDRVPKANEPIAVLNVRVKLPANE